MTRRLLISYVSIVLFVLVVLEIPLGVTFGRQQVDDLTSSVERDAFVLASLVEDKLETGSGLDIQETAQSYTDRTGGRVVVVDETGVAVVDTEPPAPGSRSFASRPEIQRALSGLVATGTRHSDTLGLDMVYAAVPVASSGVVHGAVRVTYPTSTADRRTRNNWLKLGGIAGVTLLATAGVALWLARSVSSPLRRLQVAAAGLGSGDLEVRASVDTGPPEVRDLAATFNHMAGQLEELVNAQEVFVADASHELRSPLAALRLRLENLARDASPDQQAAFDAAMEEVARLSRLVDGLLTLARASRDEIASSSINVNLREFLAERCDAWAPLAAEQDVSVVVDDTTRVVAKGTPDRLVQVLDNLIANALEASPAGGVITLRALTAGHAVEVHVVDQGPGLSEDERRHAFDRFWRSSQRRGRLGGTGLGLSIVQKLVHADDGDVELREAEGGGIDAVVRLRAGSA